MPSTLILSMFPTDHVIPVVNARAGMKCTLTPPPKEKPRLPNSVSSKRSSAHRSRGDAALNERDDNLGWREKVHS